MKIDIDFGELNQLLKKMGASQQQITISQEFSSSATIRRRLKEGIPVSIDDVEESDSGPLQYKGEQVLLYIQDHGGSVEKALADGSLGKKYHLTFCQALERMKTIGRFERYVVTDDTSGVFHISGLMYPSKRPKEGSADLKVCKYCLSKLNYNDYNSNKGAVFKEFSIKDFFSKYKPHFKQKPSRKAGKHNDSVYTDDWEDISKAYRESKNWCCEQCGVGLSSAKNLLHTHHKNGVKSDNRYTNFSALCVICHADQPSHEQMKKNIKPDDRKKILDLRYFQRNC